MSVITDLYNTLNTNAGVRAIVGTADSPQQSRIYAGIAPESKAYPLIEYEIAGDEPISTITGTGDMHRQRVQITCWAVEQDYDAAQTLADAVHTALVGTGYQERRIDIYDSRTKRHGVTIDWSYLY